MPIRRGYEHKCTDSLSIHEVFDTRPNKFMDDLVTQCKLEYLSCACLVSCPKLEGMVFKNRPNGRVYCDGQGFECVPKHLLVVVTTVT